MGSYAKLVFCLPPQVVVEPETMAEADYAGGKEVAASMLLNGSRVGMHLLYPCIAPQKELEPAELKPFLEAYNPILAQATYNDSVTGPVLWGQIGNQIFIAYQPNNLTVALVLMDINMSEKMMTTFLGNLSITLNEGATPITPGYCPDTTVAPAQATAQNNTTPPMVTDNEVTPAETSKGNLKSSIESRRLPPRLPQRDSKRLWRDSRKRANNRIFSRRPDLSSPYSLRVFPLCYFLGITSGQ